MTNAAHSRDADREAQASRLRFHQIDDQSRQLLREFWPAVEEVLPKILEGFYGHVVGEPKLAKLIGDQTPRLKSAQGTHWKRLFSGAFDEAYFQSIRTIGLVHNKIGLEPRWYIGGYSFVLRQLMQLAARQNRWSQEKTGRLCAAITQAVLLDMDIAISTYQDAMLEERQARQKKVTAAVERFGETMKTSLAAAATA